MASKRNLTTISEFRFAKNALSSPQAACPMGSKRNLPQTPQFRFAKCAVPSPFSEIPRVRSVKTPKRQPQARNNRRRQGCRRPSNSTTYNEGVSPLP